MWGERWVFPDKRDWVPHWPSFGRGLTSPCHYQARPLAAEGLCRPLRLARLGLPSDSSCGLCPSGCLADRDLALPRSLRRAWRTSGICGQRTTLILPAASPAKPAGRSPLPHPTHGSAPLPLGPRLYGHQTQGHRTDQGRGRSGDQGRVHVGPPAGADKDTHDSDRPRRRGGWELTPALLSTTHNLGRF